MEHQNKDAGAPESEETTEELEGGGRATWLLLMVVEEVVVVLWLPKWKASMCTLAWFAPDLPGETVGAPRPGALCQRTDGGKVLDRAAALGPMV